MLCSRVAHRSRGPHLCNLIVLQRVVDALGHGRCQLLRRLHFRRHLHARLHQSAGILQQPPPTLQHVTCHMRVMNSIACTVTN